MAVNEDMPPSLLCGLDRERMAERQDLMQILHLWENYVWTGVYFIVKAQRRPTVRLKRFEYTRFRTVGVHERENVRDTAGAMASEFVEAANRCENWGERRHHN
jgi:hypothetical protein